MIRYGIFATILILLAVAVTATFREGGAGVSAVGEGTEVPLGQGDLAQRLAALETAVGEERQRRAELESQIADLREQNREFAARLNLTEASQPVADGLLPDPADQLAERPERRNAGEGEIDRLVAAGFEPYRATEILRLSEELQMQMLNARYQAIRGEPIDLAQRQTELAAEFRNSLSEADYEKYLHAMRQPTSVQIGNVLASSPAESAGLQRGDQIIRYGGQRVYNMVELNRLTNTMDTSGYVVVEVLRDGQPISVSLPAGPIGISAGRGGPGPLQ